MLLQCLGQALSSSADRHVDQIETIIQGELGLVSGPWELACVPSTHPVLSYVQHVQLLSLVISPDQTIRPECLHKTVVPAVT